MKYQLLLLVLSLFYAVNTAAQSTDCPRCKGKGKIYFQYGLSTFGHTNTKKQCPICHKMVLAGVSHCDDCPDCGGRGRIVRSNGSRNTSTRNSSHSSSGVTQQYGLTPEQQQMCLDNMNSQLEGYDGFLNQNRAYGKVYKFNPRNHQGQTPLTNKISELNRASIAIFTDSGGLIIYDGNGYLTNNIRNDINDKLASINRNREVIRDITISDSGNYWCVIYGKDGWFAWHASATNEIYNKLNCFINTNEFINSVAFDSFGHYVIVGERGTVLCSSLYQDVVNRARQKFGKIISASVTDHGGCVLCCQNGVYFNGIASSIADVLKSINYIPRVIKHSYTGHYFIGDGKGGCRYWF